LDVFPRACKRGSWGFFLGATISGVCQRPIGIAWSIVLVGNGRFMARQSQRKFMKRQKESDRQRKAKEKMDRRQGKIEDRKEAETAERVDAVETVEAPEEP
jgi:hypothetical protein